MSIDQSKPVACMKNKLATIHFLPWFIILHPEHYLCDNLFGIVWVLISEFSVSFRRNETEDYAHKRKVPLSYVTVSDFYCGFMPFLLHMEAKTYH